MFRETLEQRFMNTRITSKNHDNIWPYALPTLCLLQFLWALSHPKALGVKESEHRQDDDFGSETAQNRLRNGWVAATASKTPTIFEPIGVLTRYRTSALKVYWSSSLSARRIWAPDCNISIENLEYQMIRSLYLMLFNYSKGGFKPPSRYPRSQVPGSKRGRGPGPRSKKAIIPGPRVQKGSGPRSQVFKKSEIFKNPRFSKIRDFQKIWAQVPAQKRP